MSLSDYSELTEISDTENEEDLFSRSAPPAPPVILPTPSKPARGTAGRGRAKPRSEPRLRPPRNTTYAAYALFDQLHKGLVDLNPEYQRGVVWKPTKQENLIDSLMHNYHIPPIIFCIRRDEDGQDIRVCIDGKQRLTSIKEFVLGNIGHKDSITYRKAWYSNPMKKTGRKLFTSAEKHRFDTAQIQCVEYDSLGIQDEREIFQRVQLGVTLSPTERLLATTGPHGDLVRTVLEILHPDAMANPAESLPVRQKDFRSLSEVLFMTTSDPPKEPTHTRVEKFLNGRKEVTARLRASFTQSIAILRHLIKTTKAGEKLGGNTEAARVDFVMSTYIIYRYRTQWSFAQILGAVQMMKADVRKYYKEIKMKTNVFRHMLNFILKLKSLDKSQLPSDANGDVPVATAIEQLQGVLSASEQPKETKKSNKRKRSAEDSDDDDSIVVVHFPTTRLTEPAVRDEVNGDAYELGHQSAPPKKRRSFKMTSTASPSKAKTTVKRTLANAPGSSKGAKKWKLGNMSRTPSSQMAIPSSKPSSASSAAAMKPVKTQAPSPSLPPDKPIHAGRKCSYHAANCPASVLQRTNEAISTMSFRSRGKSDRPNTADMASSSSKGASPSASPPASVPNTQITAGISATQRTPELSTSHDVHGSASHGGRLHPLRVAKAQVEHMNMQRLASSTQPTRDPRQRPTPPASYSSASGNASGFASATCSSTDLHSHCNSSESTFLSQPVNKHPATVPRPCPSSTNAHQPQQQPMPQPTPTIPRSHDLETTSVSTTAPRAPEQLTIFADRRENHTKPASVDKTGAVHVDTASLDTNPQTNAAGAAMTSNASLTNTRADSPASTTVSHPVVAFSPLTPLSGSPQVPTFLPARIREGVAAASVRPSSLPARSDIQD